MNRSLSPAARRVLLAVSAGAALLAMRPGQTDVNALPSGNAESLGEARNYDRRIELNRGFRAPARATAVLATLAGVRDLDVSRDDAFGTARSVSSLTTYLTDARPGEDAMKVALDFVGDGSLLGLTPGDLADHEVTDVVRTRVTGATHVYLRQTYLGIPVYNGQLHVNVNRDGRVLSVNNLFVPDLAQAITASTPALGLGAAVRGAAAHLGVTMDTEPRIEHTRGGARQHTTVDGAGLSLAPIEGALVWLPVRRGDVRLGWNFQVETTDRQHHYDLVVDATDGLVWTRFDWVASDQYRVYNQPNESPNHTTPVPPADGRTLQVNPANANASPFGWHDTNGAAGAEFNTTVGNNAEAYTDVDANNTPDAGSSPSGGTTRNFDFALSLAQAPSAYRPAAVTNLFYWNNVIHDVQYQYGFDEEGGNFQVNNYGHPGAGNDSVRAEAQDGSGTNNANFGTPPDGQRPRMQMYVWTAPTPDKDGDLDASIVVHEYGHGISNRLVGGPSNVSCLGNTQQAGEGLSDWWALAYTAKPGDTGPQGRGIGTYALNQPTTGVGIRQQRYSTDPAVNTWTYASVSGAAVPHGVGSRWAQGAWEVYWALVNQHGFSANLYDAAGNAGNQRAMLYVNEGLKNTICSPAFTDIRNGIIQAAVDNHGGEDVCRIWTAFAAFGLGSNAVSGGPNSTSPTNGFAVPASCSGGGGTTVYSDNFETNTGWAVNPNANDTATTGPWSRGNPEATTSSGTKQQNTTPSGVNALVTGPLAGASAGANDIDGGVTTIQSPAITLPATGTLNLTFSFYLAHGTNSSADDFFRAFVVNAAGAATQVFQETGAANNDDAAYVAAGPISLNAFAGQTVRIRFQAADAAGASLVEAAVDDVTITRQP
ncbi:MAG: M36 family metallopeptidase [Vicinamibacteria bacterium]